jgi:hypothetical protein
MPSWAATTSRTGRVRHLQWVGQEAPKVADGHELEGEAASDVAAAMSLDEGHVLVVEEEDLLHLGPGGRTVVTAVLRSGSKKNATYAAFREVGRVIRTVQLLRYLCDPALRRRVTAATNKI